MHGTVTTTECMYSSPFLCRPCGESHCVNHTTWWKWIYIQYLTFYYLQMLILVSKAHPCHLFESLHLKLSPPHLIFTSLTHRSALQSLHKACEVARCHNYFPGSLFLTWVSYYQGRVSSDQARINEWNAMQDVQSHRADSPVLFSDM